MFRLPVLYQVRRPVSAIHGVGEEWEVGGQEVGRVKSREGRGRSRRGNPVDRGELEEEGWVGERRLQGLLFVEGGQRTRPRTPLPSESL